MDTKPLFAALLLIITYKVMMKIVKLSLMVNQDAKYFQKI